MRQIFARGRRSPPKEMVVERLTGISAVLPIETASEINVREWRRRSRRSQAARTAWIAFAARRQVPKFPMPLTVTLTRLGGRKLDDDNLRSALKGTRDAIADWTGVDDGDERWTWRCEQEPGGPTGVRVEIEETR
jgi:hypothetical protein